jgi:hypothetical protein
MAPRNEEVRGSLVRNSRAISRDVSIRGLILDAWWRTDALRLAARLFDVLWFDGCFRSGRWR